MKRLLADSPWVIKSRDQWLTGASVLVEDGRIAEIGDSAELSARHPDRMRRVLGSIRSWCLCWPSLVSRVESWRGGP